MHVLTHIRAFLEGEAAHATSLVGDELQDSLAGIPGRSLISHPLFSGFVSLESQAAQLPLK
jgi:hypothetical protein